MSSYGILFILISPCTFPWCLIMISIGLILLLCILCKVHLYSIHKCVTFTSPCITITLVFPKFIFIFHFAITPLSTSTFFLCMHVLLVVIPQFLCNLLNRSIRDECACVAALVPCECVNLFLNLYFLPFNFPGPAWLDCTAFCLSLWPWIYCKRPHYRVPTWPQHCKQGVMATWMWRNAHFLRWD